jgi:two-component system OmpR family response regulator
MAPARILVVEDEPAIRDAVAAALRAEGLRVCERPDGADLEAAVAAFLPDLAILDVMLPGSRDGFALGRTLRQDSDLPILFLSARDAASSRLQGFALGADDYVVKPFVLEELLARTRALLRRSGRLRTSAVEVGDLLIDEDAGVALRAGGSLELTATELRLLSYLARNRGRVLSKLQILTQVWGYDDYDPNLVEVHVSALRRKLEAHGPRLITTVRGQGYVLRPARA